MNCNLASVSLQSGASGIAVYELEYSSPSRRLYTAYLHVCKAVSSIRNTCQHVRQLLRPTQKSFTVQCGHAACRFLWHTAAASIGFNTCFIIAAALMLLLATLVVQTCLLVLPPAIVLAPVYLLGRVWWPRWHGLPLIGPSTGPSAVICQQQLSAFQAFTASIRFRRLQTTRQTTERHLQDATLPSVRQAVLGLLTFRLPERQLPCLICLEDIGISKILHSEACNHSYCKECTTKHLQTRLREDLHNILCCPFPQCTAMLTVVQSQDLLSHDATVNISSLAVKLYCTAAIFFFASCAVMLQMHVQSLQLNVTAASCLRPVLASLSVHIS